MSLQPLRPQLDAEDRPPRVREPGEDDDRGAESQKKPIRRPKQYDLAALSIGAALTHEEERLEQGVARIATGFWRRLLVK